MSYHITLVERNALLNTFVGFFNQSSKPNPAKLNIYSDATPRPTSADDAEPNGSIILAAISFQSGAFPTATTGSVAANGLPFSTTILTNGTASWFRCFDGSASPASLGDGSITQTGEAPPSGEMVFDSINFISGGTVQISSFNITVPSA